MNENRASVIYDAETFCDDFTVADHAESSKFEGHSDEDRNLIAALDILIGNGSGDEQTGDAETFGFYARVGQFIFAQDSAGFCAGAEFASVEAAKAKFAMIELEYSELEEQVQ